MSCFRLVGGVLFGLWLCLGWAGAESALSHEALAHGGGLDRCGGHHNRKTGSYHRHRNRGGASCLSGRRSEARAIKAEKGAQKSTQKSKQESTQEGVLEKVAGRVVRIVDGDTFWLARLKVRLWGVDSPELQQSCVAAEGEVWRCGEEARARLRSVVGAGEVRCVVRGRSYDRVVGRCFVGAEDVGGALVVGGLAVEDARYSGGGVRGERGEGSCGESWNVAGLFYRATAVACAKARLRGVGDCGE